VHNDFVSGARELHAELGAAIGASADAGLRYPHEPLRDGQEVELGPYRLRVLATPGHTPE
jgi:hydroxyacylglutathione hydrolase